MGGSVTINNQTLITDSGIKLYCRFTVFLQFKKAGRFRHTEGSIDVGLLV